MEMARRRFGDALARHDLEGSFTRDLIARAADLVAVGVDDPAVLDLAVLLASASGSPFETDARIDAAREALGMLRLAGEPAEIRAAQAQFRRWGIGEIDDREVADWAWKVVGWDGAAELQPVVLVDFCFGELEHIDATEASLHRDLEEAASAILALPDSWAQ